jgi:hypothetical protein
MSRARSLSRRLSREAAEAARHDALPEPPGLQAWLNQVCAIGEDREEFEPPPDSPKALACFTYALENLGAITKDCSDARVTRVIGHLLCTKGERPHCLDDRRLDLGARARCVRAMARLWTDVFEQRVTPCLIDGVRSGQPRPMDFLCYLLWDSTDLIYHLRRCDADTFDPILVDVMAAGLTCRNVACIEGALHGLGHFQPHSPKRVPAVIEGALVKHGRDWPAALRDYAHSAALGRVM